MFSKRFLASGIAILVLIFSLQNLNAQTLEEILEKHMQALGGEKALKAQRNSVVEFDILVPGGLTGKYKSYFKYPNKLRSEMDLKIMKSLTVYDGEKGWIQDPNGQVRELAGIELEDVTREVYLSVYGYLFPERAKGEVEYLGQKEDGGINYYVVQITPEEAEPIKMFINPETYLIDKTVSKRDIIVITNYFSDYKDFGGIKVPTSQVINMGDTAYDIRSTLTNIELNPQLSDDLFKIPLPQEKDYQFPSGKNFVEIPFVLNSNHIHIPVGIGGAKPLNFILDTGAGGPILDTQTAKDLGLKSVGKFEGRGVGEATQEVNLVTLSSIRFGDLIIDSVSAATIGLKPLSKYEGMPVEGILGYDIFSRFVVKIDYENQKLTLYEPSSFEYEGKGEIFPVTLENNLPRIKAKINDQYQGNFLIDTGARSSLSLHTPFVQKHDLLAKTGKKIDIFSGIGIGGKAMGKVTRVKSIQIGSFKIPAPVTSLSASEKGALASERTDGLIGGGILKRFTVIFDYPNKRMILEPSRDFAYEDHLDMAGLWLTKENDTTEVDFVIKDSPAAKAGIKEGDLVVKINGQSTKDLLLRHIRKMLKAGEGKTVSLVINSEGKERSIELKLEKLI
jgi:outer membrane lipoprotein-sorting protein/predicted aspartyl protease